MPSRSDRRPRPVYLADYTPPPFLVQSVDLRFELDEEQVRVHSRLALERNPQARDGETLVLDGGALEPERVAIDGETLGLNRYSVSEERLSVSGVPDRFTLEVTTRLRPQDNTSLEGLYRSGRTFCTQCEAQGFRQITWFPDRPDVVASYTTTIVADRDRYPVLLSNGNLAESGELDGNRHWVRWEDPYRKPSYLFALVAGDLACVEDRFVTRSGRRVTLRIYVEHHNHDKCDHAMASLKKAMRWDEETFGLEYDLDIYMIVAVDDFNMGAMENKGLNIFNSKYVLANPQTATDADYAAIEGVIAHEYFHNWTGNRVTCRDWFQLSLKEGLTVFRDQEFSSDVQSRPVKRIHDVRVLRTHQFPEDAGPMAHPVRPDSYIEISNFYTATVYEKGAEVIRMMHTLLGREGFRRGMALYFRRHDGKAVTTDDFVSAMEDANEADLGQFRRWYTQAGTPVVSARGHYDEATASYELELRQSSSPTPGQDAKEPLHIPVATGLLGPGGVAYPVYLEGEDRARAPATTRVLELRRERERFRFTHLPGPPVVSLLRGFSAPVRLDIDRGDEELAFLLAHDADPFNRWDAGQTLATRLVLRLMGARGAGRPMEIDQTFSRAFATALDRAAPEPALAADTLALPSEAWLAENMEIVDIDAIHEVRQYLRRTLAERLREHWMRLYDSLAAVEPYRFEAEHVGRRSLRNLALGYLMELDDPEVRAACVRQFRTADNMTDTLAALACLANADCPERVEALEEFHASWRDEPLVLDKWFAIQASSRLPGTLAEVKTLMHHRAFQVRNPNKVRALIGAFCHTNQVRFHAADGAGYRFLSERVLELDPVNPQVAARLLGALARWRKLDGRRQALVRVELERILASGGLSKDVYEIASKTLG